MEIEFNCETREQAARLVEQVRQYEHRKTMRLIGICAAGLIGMLLWLLFVAYVVDASDTVRDGQWGDPATWDVPPTKDGLATIKHSVIVTNVCGAGAKAGRVDIVAGGKVAIAWTGIFSFICGRRASWMGRCGLRCRGQGRLRCRHRRRMRIGCCGSRRVSISNRWRIDGDDSRTAR